MDFKVAVRPSRRSDKCLRPLFRMFIRYAREDSTPNDELSSISPASQA